MQSAAQAAWGGLSLTAQRKGAGQRGACCARADALWKAPLDAAVGLGAPLTSAGVPAHALGRRHSERFF